MIKLVSTLQKISHMVGFVRENGLMELKDDSEDDRLDSGVDSVNNNNREISSPGTTVEVTKFSKGIQNNRVCASLLIDSPLKKRNRSSLGTYH